MTTRWIHAAHRDELRPDVVKTVELPRDSRGRPQEALVVESEHGRIRAYLNRCQHIAIPLDAGSREFLDPATKHLRCGTHGALYRREDGLCVAGPCIGEALVQLPIRIGADGTVEVRFDGPTE